MYDGVVDILHRVKHTLRLCGGQCVFGGNKVVGHQINGVGIGDAVGSMMRCLAYKLARRFARLLICTLLCTLWYWYLVFCCHACLTSYSS